MYVLIFIILTFVIYKNIDHFRYNRSHLKNKELVKEQENFVTTDTCKNITEILVNHPKMTMGGFCIRFVDDEYTEQVFEKNGLIEVYNVFKTMKAPGTKYYICNVLIVPTSSGVKVGEHYDGTHETTDWLNRQYMPMCTSVLYLNLPNTFQGGELFLKKFNSNSIYKSIKPVIGKMVEFRGDMAHGVNEIHSSENVDRLSLVFEQYTVSNNTKFKIEPIFTEVEKVGDEIYFS